MANTNSTEVQPARPFESLTHQLTLAGSDRSLRLLKRAIWTYYFLVIFEGALRKWFLPGLAGPLLLIRDPLALWILLSALTQNRLRANQYLISALVIGTIGLFTAVLLGHGNLTVAIFGARILLIHFPLIFVIASVFNARDVVSIGIVTLWIALPMTILIAFQFYSPQSAWVNLGVGGDTAGGGFSGALGYFRPPGTFSFTTGTTQFYSFAACFILYFWLKPGRINRIMHIGATIGLVAAIPLSISRSLLFQVALSIAFTAIAVSRKPKYVGRMILAVLGTSGVLAILSQISFFQTSTGAFTERFTSANENEGGLEGVFIDRFLGGMIGAITGSADLPFLGYGLGMGTNVGAQLLTGERAFLISEGEWGRVIGELGPLLGLMVILIRVSLTTEVTISCYKKLRAGDLLPWLLLSYGLITLSQGGWAQPTSLGFCILISGLMMASLRR